MQVYKIDNEGYYIEPIIIKEGHTIPKDCVEIPPINGLFKPKFYEGQWINGLSQQEIEKLTQSPVQQKPRIEILQETVDQLVLESLMRGI